MRGWELLCCVTRSQGCTGKGGSAPAACTEMSLYNRRDIKAIVEGPPHKLIESVAERIAQQILEGHPLVHSVQVGVHKPQVAVSGVVKSLGIEITRVRGS